MASPDLRLRSAGRGDRQFFFDVRRAAFRTYVEEISGWDDAVQRDLADREFAELPIEIVEESGHAVGYQCVLHNDECDFIEEMALLPEARGRGIGTELLRGILRDAQHRNVPVRLSVFTDNPAQGLYARLGFIVTSVEPPRAKLEWTPT